LSAIVGGATVELDTLENAQVSAARMQAALDEPLLPNQVEVVAEYHAGSEANRLIIRRKHHGNVRATVIDNDFVNGADYGVLARAAATFQGLIGKGAMVARGEGEKRKESMVSDFREAMLWLRGEAERMVSKQRYKGLGEMNPEQLWETTMDPKVRRLLRVQIEDAIAADEIFTTLMGDNVEPRRAFIETHALQAANLDV
jgi:DNA gyrase subunit B